MKKLNKISSFTVLVYLAINVVTTMIEFFSIRENSILYLASRIFTILLAIPCYFAFKKNCLDFRYQILLALSLLVYNLVGYYFRPMYVASFIHSIYALSFFIFMTRKNFIFTSGLMTLMFTSFTIFVRNDLPYSAGEQTEFDLIIIPLIALIVAIMIHYFYTAQRQLTDYANIQFGTLGRISARAIHDIKSGLGSPLLATELIDKAILENNYKEIHTQSKNIANQFVVLKDYLLSLNQISAISEMTEKSFLISDCLTEAESILKPHLAKSNICKTGDLKMFGPEKLMTSIFINLISNTIENLENHPRAQINISIEVKNNSVYYTDLSSQVSDDTYRRIKSQMYYTSKSLGSGLGLFFIREAAEQLNANFFVYLKNNHLVFELKF